MNMEMIYNMNHGIRLATFTEKRVNVEIHFNEYENDI